MDHVAIENALHAWVTGALGVEAIWGDPPAPAPTKPYGVLRLSGPTRLGFGGELVDATNGATPGEEVELTLREHQELVLAVQVYAKPTSGAGTAKALLEACAMRMRLPSALTTLRSAGLAVIEVGDTSDLSTLFGTAIESRAVLEVRLRTVDQATERTGYIAKVAGTSPWGAWRTP